MATHKFSTQILDSSLQKARIQREELRRAVLSALCSALEDAPVPLGRVIIFGSLVAPDRFRPESDVDVAIESIDPRDYFILKSHLEGRLLREVDLIDLDRCPSGASIRQAGVVWKNHCT